MFCGSSPGARPGYAELAEELGRTLADRGIGLVYGGGNVGLMGRLADTVLEAGGEVIGVIPASLVEREVAHAGLSDCIVVESMFDRKGRMMELADGFVTIPGGVGTLDELFEVLTWNQLGLIAKPCGLLDVDGFFTELERFLDALVRERFLRPQHRELLLREPTAAGLLARMASWEPPQLAKWLDR